MNTLKTRLLEIKQDFEQEENRELKKQDFAERLGITPGRLTQCLDGDNKTTLGQEPLIRLFRKNYNLDWVVSGTKPKFRGDDPKAKTGLSKIMDFAKISGLEAQLVMLYRELGEISPEKQQELHRDANRLLIEAKQSGIASVADPYPGLPPGGARKKSKAASGEKKEDK